MMWCNVNDVSEPDLVAHGLAAKPAVASATREER